MCIHHLLFNSKFWPVSQRVHITHFRPGAPNVISTYISSLLYDHFIFFQEKQSTSSALQHVVRSGFVKNVNNVNEVRLTFGSRGYGTAWYNDLVNGWIGADLLNATAKSTTCNSVLSLHQVYPNVMIDLWSHITTGSLPDNYSEPVLSRDIENLDSSTDY